MRWCFWHIPKSSRARRSHAQPHRRVPREPPLVVQGATGQQETRMGRERSGRIGEVDDADQALAPGKSQHARGARAASASARRRSPAPRGAGAAPRGRARASSRDRRPGARRRTSPQSAGCGSHGSPADPKPNGGPSPRPGQRHPAAVAARVGAAGAEVHRVLDAGRAVPPPRAGPAPRPGRGRRRRAAPASAAPPARARRVPRARSVGVPKRFAAKSNVVSARPYRVTVRVTSWLDSTQVAGAPTGACSGERHVDGRPQLRRVPRARTGSRS